MRSPFAQTRTLRTLVQFVSPYLLLSSAMANVQWSNEGALFQDEREWDMKKMQRASYCNERKIRFASCWQMDLADLVTYTRKRGMRACVAHDEDEHANARDSIISTTAHNTQQCTPLDTVLGTCRASRNAMAWPSCPISDEAPACCDGPSFSFFRWNGRQSKRTSATSASVACPSDCNVRYPALNKARAR